MATIKLLDTTFEKILTKNDILIVDFWASWCGPCQSFAPIYEKVSDKHPDIVFGKVDTESEQELSAHFKIRSIPMLMIFREQITLFSQAGMLTESQLDNVIGKVRELDMDTVRAEIATNETKK